jgi:hypothetical protein
MEKRRLGAVLVLATTFAVSAVAVADAPGPMPQTHAKRKSRKPAAPKMSDKCKSDDDCTMTRFADGACCPMLCQARAVSKKFAEAIKKYAAECKKEEGGCAVADCAPPRVTMQPACVSGKCVARAAPSPTLE